MCIRDREKESHKHKSIMLKVLREHHILNLNKIPLSSDEIELMTKIINRYQYIAHNQLLDPSSYQQLQYSREQQICKVFQQLMRNEADNSIINFKVFETTLSKSENQSKEEIAVSYTHLRAHETRHDLVCRLLLEKKKKDRQLQPNDIQNTKKS
eukprot:TRINITY_DN5474_c0_g3_i1.p1 TRINITY_DN5474_c0_g3~~TRINITY_DN5474_c0_g3_i1.p1  ORF type:complete len:154 (+),score=25.34 TRINITY_DN5474_c0_g3_i1:140-601(+)